MSKRRVPFASTAAVLLLVCVATSPPPVAATPDAPKAPAPERPAPKRESREAILAEFRQIAADIEAGDNFYWGKRPLADHRAKLAAAPNAREELDLRMRVAWEELKLAEVDAAIANLEACLALVERHKGGVPAQRAVLRRLALAELRAGETQNCVHRHGAESCIFPIRGGGVHEQKDHAKRAVAHYRRLLSLQPDSRAARWLLGIAAMQAAVYPEAVPPEHRLPEALTKPAGTFPRFPNVSTRLGFSALNLAGGTITEDFDGDGFLDVMFSTCDPAGSITYYRAQGDGTYTSAAAGTGLDVQLGGLNLMQTDYDDDGRPDVLVTRGGWQGGHGKWRLSLLHNEGDGTFADVTRHAGLASSPRPTQAAAWGDYDGDGDLDIYVAAEVDQPPVAGFSTEGKPFPCQLFRSNGDGTFTDVAPAAGVTNDRMAKGVAWGDADGDGDLDLYVSNIGPNRLYENLGSGKFRDVAPERGLTEPVGRSFATWFWDYDNDGNLDIFVAGFLADVESVARHYLGDPVSPKVMRSRLYRGTGGGKFEEVSVKVGLDGVSLPMGANYGDLDNDGYPDIYLGTGDPEYETLTPNVMYRNVAGTRFEDVTFSGGFGHLQKGHGIAFADLDNDGDQDVVLEAGGFFPGDVSPNVVYENPGNGNHFLTVRLVGAARPGPAPAGVKRSNRAGYGVRIRVRVKEGERTRDIHALGGTGGSFGASALQQEIGLGAASRIEELEVLWPTSGRRQRFTAVPMDAFVEVREDADELVRLERKRVKLGG